MQQLIKLFLTNQCIFIKWSVLSIFTAWNSFSFYFSYVKTLSTTPALSLETLKTWTFQQFTRVTYNATTGALTICPPVCIRFHFKIPQHKQLKCLNQRFNRVRYLVCATPLCTADCQLAVWGAARTFWSLRREDDTERLLRGCIFKQCSDPE